MLLNFGFLLSLLKISYLKNYTFMGEYFFRNPITKMKDANEIHCLVDWDLFNMETDFLGLFLEKCRRENLFNCNTYIIDYNDIWKFIKCLPCAKHYTRCFIDTINSQKHYKCYYSSLINVATEAQRSDITLWNWASCPVLFVSKIC